MTTQFGDQIVVTRPFEHIALDALTGIVGVEVRVLNEGEASEQGRLQRELAQATGVLSMISERFNSALLASLPKLKVISNMAVGFDNIDIRTATDRGVVVCNTPDVLTETTAELAIGLMFATSRRVVEADRFVRDGRWTTWTPDMLMGRDLAGSVLGIVGAGRIGRAVATRARALGMTVVYTSRSESPEMEKVAAARRLELDDLLREADVVSLHVPLSSATRGLIDRQKLALMKRTAILINTARGPIVDELALASALAGGRLYAAGLDVFEQEPMVSPALLKLDNAVLLPHIGSATVATRRRMAQVAVENLARFFAGRAPVSVVNPAALDANRPTG